MLAQHPQIAIAGKYDFLVDAISPEGRFLKRDAFVRKLALDRTFGDSGLSIAPKLNFAGLANDFLDQVAATRPGAIAVGATVHHDFDRLLRLWPDARFIHLVRDGRDVALSTIPMGWAGNMWRAIGPWADVEKLWEEMANKLPYARQLTVKYETLVSDPEYELRRITDFLGLPFLPDMLRTNAASREASIGKWRNANPADLSAAEFRAARGLLQNGYFLSGSVKAPSILRRISLRIQDRMVIAMNRKSLFGTRLWLASIYTKRFGSAKARARVSHEQNEMVDRGGK